MHYGYEFWPFAGILSVLFWVLIILLIVRLVHGPRRWREYRDPRDLGPRNSALDILKERYAKGEINKQEFEEKKADLMK